MSYYEDLEEALIQAVEIKKGNIPLVEVEGMPAPTYRAANLNDHNIEKTLNKSLSNCTSIDRN